MINVYFVIILSVRGREGCFAAPYPIKRDKSCIMFALLRVCNAFGIGLGISRTSSSRLSKQLAR